MQTRRASYKQLLDATVKNRTKGITEKSVKRIFRDLRQGRQPSKLLTYEQQKQIIDKAADELGENAFKGYSQGKRGIRGAILKNVKQIKDTGAKEIKNPNKESGLLMKLRQKYSQTTALAQNQPQISAQGSEAIISGARMTGQKTPTKTKQTEKERPQKQNNKALPMDIENRQKTIEAPEADLDAPAGFEITKKAS